MGMAVQLQSVMNKVMRVQYSEYFSFPLSIYAADKLSETLYASPVSTAS
jgi:hypothetical protein